MPLYRPEERDYSEDHFITIISGLPGVGKTTLACSASNVAIIDVDNGMKRVKPEHRKDAIVVNTYEELLEDMRSKEIAEKETIVIDTTGAFIELLKNWAMRNNSTAVKKGGGISIQGFGIVKSEFLRFSNEVKKTHNLIYIFHTSKSKDKEGNQIFELMCEGATREIVWQPADLGAYLYISDNNRYLGFSPTQEYSAKSSYGIKGSIKVPELKDGDENDFLNILFETAKKNIKEEAQTFKLLKTEYDSAIKAGKEIISRITKPDEITQAMKDIKDIKHSLTSEKELKSLFKEKIKQEGIVWNGAKKVYEYEKE